MAPIFYCLCDRCNCTATVLITQYIRNTKKIINDDQDFGVTSRVEDLHTQVIPSEGDLEESKTRSNCPTTDKHVGVDEDSVIILLCLVVLAIGEHYLLTQTYSVYRYSVLVRVFMSIRNTISQGRIARWEERRMVGGLQVKVSFEVGRAVQERPSRFGNIGNSFAMIFGSRQSEGRREEMRGSTREVKG